MKKYIIPILVLFSLSACKNDDDDCAEEVCSYTCTCEYEDGTIQSNNMFNTSRSEAREVCESTIDLWPVAQPNPPINCYIE